MDGCGQVYIVCAKILPVTHTGESGKARAARHHAWATFGCGLV
jgi:hypothetical protein